MTRVYFFDKTFIVAESWDFWLFDGIAFRRHADRIEAFVEKQWVPLASERCAMWEAA